MRILPSAILFLILLPSGLAHTESPVVEALAARGELGIPAERARLLESELGQLFIVNVDGFGAAGPLALEDSFAPMVRRLQIGGVIPHYGSSSYPRIRRTNRALADMTRLPLLVCSDIVRLRSHAGTGSAFGDGFAGGFIGKYRALPDDEFRRLAELNAFVFAALGVNIALGPTVDDSTGDPGTVARAQAVVQEVRRFGIQPVLKHFPFLPRSANLHRSSPDTRLALPAAEKRFSVFRDLGEASPILMTTHLDDSLVDTSIVTFSSAWLAILRRETDFSGLLMSDGLLMLKNYADQRAFGRAPAALSGLDPTAVWAVRAILAGHDFVIVEGSARQTEKAFQGVLAAACSGTSLGNELAARVEGSYERIRRFKLDNAALLSRQIDVPPSVVDSVIAMTPRDGDDLKAFRFDQASLDAVAPQLERAAVKPAP